MIKPMGSKIYKVGCQSVIILTVILLFTESGGVADDDTALGRVAMVIDGRTLRLSDGQAIRLIGLGALQPLSGLRPQQSSHPTDGTALNGIALKDSQQPPINDAAAAARAALETLLLGQDITLHIDGQDRYGRWLADVIRGDGLWIQGAMLGQGWGRVHSLGDHRERIGEMLAIEAQARREKAGIWADPAYRVVAATSAEKAIGNFAIITGRVRQIAVVKGTTFLNFGDDWREDFTIRIAARDRRRFDSAGVSISDYQGRKIRVRGMVESWNGPMIKIDHPERIEILD